MAPQATAAPQDKTNGAKDAEKAAAEKAEREWAELVERATGTDDTPARQIKRAIALEEQRGELMEKISNNRTYLRLMDQNEELTDDQARFLDTFYPEKEKGERRPKAEVEATRRARAAARKGKGSDEDE